MMGFKIPWLWLVAASLVVGNAAAQGAGASGTSARPLTQAEVKARYQNCPRGYYSGPRPGKVRYTKDPWVWAVTPEFAAAFCMPPEFISKELKGAEAVAYKMVQEQDEISCGWGDKAELCMPGTEHRFEICYKTGAIPKERDLRDYHIANLPSVKLLTKLGREFDEETRRIRANPRLGAIGVFGHSPFGLMSVRDSKFAWPIGSLAPQIYVQEVFTGIDYVALQGGEGFAKDRNWLKHGTHDMVITVRRFPDPFAQKSTYEMSFDQFALIITLPRSISDQVVRNDRERGIDLMGMARSALGASSPGR